ncbi:MAG: exodeoxyribonuclease III [Thermomicrobiales bacterium]|nr:exodeoxyribonuclease III [Thermomicrobiales bacterium]
MEQTAVGMRIYSWNINGVRAALRKGLAEWLDAAQPDVLCLQETRLGADMVPDELQAINGYHTYWSPLVRRGYGGVATFSRREPCAWSLGLDLPGFDDECRVLVTEYPAVVLYNVYFPNGRSRPERLAYKLAFYQAFLEHLSTRADDDRCVIFCGDMNTAHHAIDLARPKQHLNESGFLPEERAWLDRFQEAGWVDTFRHCFPFTSGVYTWWDPRTRARSRNTGWRIDSGFISAACLPHLTGAGICTDVVGSDHCPIWMQLDLDPGPTTDG